MIRDWCWCWCWCWRMNMGRLHNVIWTSRWVNNMVIWMRVRNQLLLGYELWYRTVMDGGWFHPLSLHRNNIWGKMRACGRVQGRSLQRPLRRFTCSRGWQGRWVRIGLPWSLYSLTLCPLNLDPCIHVLEFCPEFCGPDLHEAWRGIRGFGIENF